MQANSELRPWRTLSLVLLIATLVLSGFIGFRMFRSRSEISGIVAGFGVETNLLTTVVLSTWYVFVIPALAFGGIIKELILTNRRISTVCNAVHFFLVIVLWQLYVDGVWGPILQVLIDLS